MTARLGVAVLAFSCLALGGCTGAIAHLHPFDGTRSVGCSDPRSDEVLDLTYMGVGGFLIRWRGHTIVTAPFYSNPGLLQVGLGLPIEPNTTRIDTHLPPFDQVEAILVGHAHYDHLMDAVYVAETYAPHAVIYGNETMAHILASRDGLHGRVVALDKQAGDWWQPGRWQSVAGGAIRFMALRSEHAPHVLGIKLFGGSIDQDQERLPRTAYGWKEGQTFAFLIDFLDADGHVRLRLHYQDAASNPPAGFVPPPDSGDSSGLAWPSDPTGSSPDAQTAAGGQPVDVAILCVASFGQVDDYPEAIVRQLQPQTVVLGHWENFFRSPDLPLEAVPLTDTKTFALRLTDALPVGARWYTPRPNATLHICPRRKPT
jgi:L-ascorbate metabolism protein UlaG (beta-lactamase superfamily)